MPTDQMSLLQGRQHHLDWIRVSAFGLLILYHVGMFYVSWDWHVKSSHAGHAIEPLMFLTNPWRLTLLFIVSGAATRFMADKLPASKLARSRTARLLPPLLLGMLVIVPPQSYYEVVEKLGYDAGYLAFQAKYLTGYGGFCQAGDCLIVPTWNHLWFVAYLLVYTLVVACLLVLAHPLIGWLEAGLPRALRGWRLIVWPAVFLAVLRAFLLPHFEPTHALIDDWYNHAVSFSAFLFGFTAVRSPVVTESFIRYRWTALGLAAAAYVLYAGYAWIYRAEDAIAPEQLRLLMRIVYAVDQWCAIAAIFGFAARHLTRSTPLLRYLTDAVFPFYIVHQTLIVVAGHHLSVLGLAPVAEASALILCTVVGCLLTYETVRRMPLLRPLFGLKPNARSFAPTDAVRAGAVS